METRKLSFKMLVIKNLTFLLFVFFKINLHAQVTIGSDIPPSRAALLELKEKEPDTNNSTAEKGGLLLPRVSLKNKVTLLPFIANDANFRNNVDKVKDRHTGLIVYNVTTDFVEDLCPGTYEWDGNVWKRLSAPCTFFELICSTLQTNQYTQNNNTAFNEPNSIKYNSSIQKNITAPLTHSYGNGLSINIPVQNISATSNGTLNFTVSGDGTTLKGLYTLSLSELSNILGFDISSDCYISVIISSPQVTLQCGIETATAELGINMDKTVRVYASSDRIPYTLPAGSIGQAVGGISPSIETPQTITSVSGDIINVTLKGIPENPGKISIPITIGNATCNIEVDVNAPFDISCSDVYVTGFIDQDLSETTSPVYVPYTMSGGTFKIPAGEIGTNYGVTAYVEEQNLTATSGTISVKFRGMPIQTLDKVPFEINLQGNSCFIHLSVITPPTVCPDGKVAKALVFTQNNKWYVITPYGSYNVSSTDTRSVAGVVECSSEEEALRHPDAVQYCGDQSGNRCIRLFDRRGAYVANIHMSQESAGWYNNTGILISGNSCWDNIIATPGNRMRCTSLKTGFLGAVGLTGGVGYLGITTQTAVLTDKPLR